jgi:copper chaperone CopZ
MKTILGVLLTAVVALGCVPPADEEQSSLQQGPYFSAREEDFAGPSPGVGEQATNLQTTVLHVPGMSCPGCVLTSLELVEQTRGVHGVQADVEREQLTVTYDPQLTNPNALAATVTDGTEHEAKPVG